MASSNLFSYSYKLTRLIALLIIITPAWSQSNQLFHSYIESGAAPNSTISGGLGVSLELGFNQELITEFDAQTHSKISQATSILVGIKSNSPAIPLSAHRSIRIFTVVTYGAGIVNIPELKFNPYATQGEPLPVDIPSLVNYLGTSVGLSQKYGIGVQSSFGKWIIGSGVDWSSIQSVGWSAYPFIFISRSFGK